MNFFHPPEVVEIIFRVIAMDLLSEAHGTVSMGIGVGQWTGVAHFSKAFKTCRMAGM